MKFGDVAAQQAFERAVVNIEAASGAEVMVAIRARSAAYAHVHGAVAALCGFALLAFMLFSENEFSLLWILVLPLVAAAVGVLMCEAVPWIRRVGTSTSQRHRATQRAAQATFVELGVHRTTARVGVLFYFSLLERSCTVIADQAVAAAVAAPELAALEAQLAATMAAGGVATANAMDRILPLLKTLPRRANDRNELPDRLNVKADSLPYRTRLFGGRV
ncbi:MAG: hypothetical protein KBG15_05290 [Kofleriaceae bacterium]|nr:hypothetical protein [Kofleriaceae bacterium]